MNPIERPLNAAEQNAVASISQTIAAAKQIHPQDADVLVWNELDRYSTQIGLPREQVEKYLREEWEVKMTHEDWQIYELMANLMTALTPVIENREEKNVSPVHYVSWLAAKALGEKGWFFYRPDSPANIKRRAAKLKQQLKELEEAQKLSPDVWTMEFTI